MPTSCRQRVAVARVANLFLKSMGSCHFALKQPSRTTLKMHSSALRKLKAESFAWATTTHIFFIFVYEHYITKSYSLSVDQRASRNPLDTVQKNTSVMVYVGERAHYLSDDFILLKSLQLALQSWKVLLINVWSQPSMWGNLWPFDCKDSSLTCLSNFRTAPSCLATVTDHRNGFYLLNQTTLLTQTARREDHTTQSGWSLWVTRD